MSFGLWLRVFPAHFALVLQELKLSKTTIEEGSGTVRKLNLSEKLFQYLIT